MIRQSKYITEAEIQAILYGKLVTSGLSVGLEQNVKIEGQTRSGRVQKIRIDVAIFKGYKIIGCIEVKADRRKKAPNRKSRQYGKYESLKTPFRFCLGMKEIDSCVDWAKGLEA